MPDQSQDVVLVTGGAGFLGANLTRSLLNDARYDEYRVLLVDDLTGGSKENVPDDSRVCFRKLDVTEPDEIDRLFVDFNIRHVFHLAAYAAEGLSHFIRRFNYRNNLVGSINLINASVRAEVKHFVFTSSIAVYGAAQVPMREETVPCPEDPYGIAKYAVELDLKAASQLFQLPFTIFRPHNVYGEFQNIGDRYRNVIGIFMNRILQGRPLPIFGDGTQQRAFSYVQDLMNPMISAPFVDDALGEVFNIGARQPVSVRRMAEVACEEFGVEPNFEFLPGRNEVHSAWAEHAKCDRVFGMASQTALEDGIRRMADWVRTAGPRSSQRFEHIEIERNLPPSWQC